jgi:hypothetical protein
MKLYIIIYIYFILYMVESVCQEKNEGLWSGIDEVEVEVR